MPKSTQTREDLKVKVNIKSPIPTASLYCEKIYKWIKLHLFSFFFLVVYLYESSLPWIYISYSGKFH